MIKEGRETKQGIRDLNYYGPKRVKEGAEAPATAGGPTADAVPPGPAPIEAHNDAPPTK